MGYRAVLDANVLYPFSLRDTLLRCAEAELFDLVWSSRIIDETRKNLVKNDAMTPIAALIKKPWTIEDLVLAFQKQGLAKFVAAICAYRQ